MQFEIFLLNCKNEITKFAKKEYTKIHLIFEMTKKKAEIYELEISAIGFEGVAIARMDNIVVFVKNAVPGDFVEVMITRKKKSFWEAKLLRVIKPSPDRVMPDCQYFVDCGGCSWQNLHYDNQLIWKTQHVKDAMQRIGKLDVDDIKDILPSPKSFRYRNKMEFSFSTNRWLSIEEIQSEVEFENKNFALGLHAPGRFDKVLDIDYCLIQPEEGDKIINITRKLAIQNGISAYNAREFDGFLRTLMLRYSVADNNIMIVLTSKAPKTDAESIFAQELSNTINSEVNNIAGFIWAINDTRSPVGAQSYELLYGKDYITEDVLGVKFKISPTSFFQTNSFQLEHFIKEIIDAAQLTENDILWDLYCGAGSITLPAAKICKQVIGAELVESSVLDARANAQRNGIVNATFLQSDLHNKHIPETLLELPKPDVVIFDPPRAGMHSNLIEHILEIKPPRIVYASCNPATQARDLAFFEPFYNINYIQPVDMFPHTFHVETVAQLRLKE